MPISRRHFLVSTALAALLPRAVAEPPVLRRSGRTKRVIVLGAGLAGLCAARELVRAGHEVIVLEARRRPGGRVMTLRDFADGLFAEAGAARIPDHHELPMGFAKQLGLELVPFYPTHGDSMHVMRGRRVRVPATGPMPLAEYPVELTAEELELGVAGLYGRLFGPPLPEAGDPREGGWPEHPKLAGLDDITWAQYFERLGLSKGAHDVMGLGFTDPDGDRVSALWMLRENALLMNLTAFFRIRGGNDQLPRGLARDLTGRIHYGAEVSQIVQDARRVRAYYWSAGSPRVVEGDRLVCTIPFSVLRDLSIEPAWSIDKRRAIQGMDYYSLSRAVLQVRERYWEADGLSGFGRDDNPSELWHTTFDMPGPRGLLTWYARGAASTHLGGLEEQERCDWTVQECERFLPGLRRHVEGCTVKCWSEDPWARGAMPWIRPGQVADLLPHVSKPEGRVHFAGEHTSIWHGWMQGALASGLRAAREVNDA